MPAQLQFFDMAVSLTPPTGHLEPLPLTLGPNWQPNDIRLSVISAAGSGSGGQSALMMPMDPDPPTGFAAAYAMNPSRETYGAYWRRLAPGDADTSVRWPRPAGWQYFMNATLTVRGVSATANPTAGRLDVGYTRGDSTGTVATVSPVAVPGAGAMLLVLGAIAAPSKTPWPNWAVSLGVPTGWTNLVATDKSGDTFHQYGTDPSLIVIGRSFAAAGSTGTVQIPTAHGNPAFAGMWVFLTPGADVSAAITPASETGTASVVTPSVSTAVTYQITPASETGRASRVANGLSGFRISDPLELPGNPVTGSVIRWAATTPPGTTVAVETSINGGASWDPATNNTAVPRLRPGDTTTRSVLTRVTLTRASLATTSPTVPWLELQVSVDAGVDELVPLAHGIIDKDTIKANSGTSGGGSSAGVSGAGVTTRGGGQHGGGTSLKIHGTDPSRAIKRNAWQQPFFIPAGTNYADAVRLMVLDRLPSQTEFSLASTEHVTPLLVFGADQGGDPWQDIAELGTAIGFECYFDPAGVFVFRPVPDPRRGEPVWEFDPDANPVVTEAKRDLADEQTFNYVIVKGESTSTKNPITAFAFDDDPSSPTYVNGPYGTVTTRLTFPQIATQEQAQAAADALLLNSLGAADTVTLTVVPMAALEPGDVVTVNVPDVRAAGTYLINQVTTSLSPAEPQQLVCHRQSTSR